MKRLILLLLFPLLAQAETVNHCYDPVKKKTVFTDQPCEKVGLVLKKVVDGAMMNRADPTPVVRPVQIQTQTTYYTAPQETQRSTAGAMSRNEYLCAQLELQKAQLSGSDDYSKRRYAEILYSINKNCR